MFQITTPTFSQFHEFTNSIKRRLIPSANKDVSGFAGIVETVEVPDQPRGVLHFLRLMFISGPKLLLTSRISGKCAALMVMLCSPSLLCCSLLTLPAMLFPSPNQHAYFQFAKILEQDPSRWIVLALAAVCAVLALAIPATTQPSASYY